MTFAAVVERLQKLENPYPGLRPFETDEAHAFFGRDQQVADLLTRLERNRFLAVVGVSGSGKSSLVRAGLIPALERGRVADADERWRVVVTRPTGAPFESLAADLAKAGLDGTGLKESSLGLVATARRLPDGESLLLVVDQFEELFRYKDLAPVSEQTRQRRDAAAAEAAEFVQLLLASSEHHPPVHVVITMRSDYLGDCAEFRDLPETLNDCQYLVPRLTRQQRKEAIEGPLGLVNMAPSLVQRILNDAGDEPDQLPVLQHALMRTWNHWHADDPEHSRAIGLQDYAAIGGFDGALNQHADELLSKVPREIASTVFKRLTARGRTNREHRDPATLAELWAVRGAETPGERSRVTAVVDRFRRGEATFLTPRDGDIGPDDYVDITHESLIRQWRTLRDEWVVQEHESAKAFLDLIDRARNWQAGKGEVLGGLDLTHAVEWERQRNKTDAWAAHYAEVADLHLVRELIQASQAAERKRRWRSWGLWIAVPVAVIFAGLAGMAVFQMFRATNEAGRAREAQRSAEQSQAALGRALAEVTTAREQAVAAQNEADGLRKKAEAAQADAEREGATAQRLGTLSLSRLLIAQSDRVERDQFDLEPSVLLAVESIRRVPGFDADRALRESAARLPREIARVTHQTPVSTVAPGPDGRWVVAGLRNGAPWVARLDDANDAGTLAQERRATHVAVSANGRWVATNDADDVVRVFAVGEREPTASLMHGSAVVALAVTPNGRFVATSDPERMVRVWETAVGKEVWSQQHADTVNAVAISADGRWVATGSGSPFTSTPDNSARVFDRMSDKEVSRLTPNGPVRAVAMSADARWVTIGSDDNTARVFEAATGKEISRQAHRAPVTAVAISADGRWVASGSGDRGGAEQRQNPDNTVRVFERQSGREVARIAHQDAIVSVAFSADGRRVASTAEDNTTRVFDAAGTAAGGGTRVQLQNTTTAMAFSGDGRYVATGSGVTGGGFSAMLNRARALLRQNGARMFEVADGTEVAQVMAQVPTRAVAISRDGRYLATGGDDNFARVFEASTNKTWIERRTVRHFDAVRAVALSADGQYMASGGEDGTTRVIEVATGRDTPIPGRAVILAVAFGPTGNRLATANGNNTVRILDMPLNRETVVRLDQAVSALAFSRDGRWIATGIGVFDAASGKPVSRFTAPLVDTIVFSDDDRRVAVGGRDGTTRVFDTASGRELARISVGGRVGAVRFAERDRYLVSASATTGNEVVVARHALQAQDLIDDACARVTRNLSDTQWQQHIGSEVPYRKTCPDRP